MNKINKLTFGQAVGLWALLSSTAMAQEEAAGGTIMTLGVSQRLSYTDNHDFSSTPEGAFIATTGLNFALSSATKVDTIAMNVRSGLSYDSNDNEFVLADPSLTLAYQQTSKNAGFSGSLGYSETDISSTTDIVAGEDTFVILDEGTRVSLGGRAAFDFGRTDPISGNVTLTHNRVWYRDTTSADLVDQETTGLSGSLSFRVDDRISTNVSGSLSRRTTDDGVDTTNTGFGAGVVLAYSKRLSLDAGLQFNRVEQTTNGVTARSEGLGFSLGAGYEMPDGEITASLTSSIDENGRIYNGRVGRQMALKNGNLGFSFGLTGREGDSLNPLYTLNYNQELPRDAKASFALSQSFATNDNGRDAVNTSLSANYETPLSKVSQIGASLAYRGTDVTNFAGEDVSRVDLTVNYSHALVQDWGVTAGYTHSLASSDTEADRRSNTVFIGVQKDFSWRP